LLANPRAEAAFRDDVYAPPEQVLQIHQQAAEVEQTAARAHAHDKINVTRFIGLATGHRPKHANVDSAILGGKLEHFASVALQRVCGSHDRACRWSLSGNNFIPYEVKPNELWAVNVIVVEVATHGVPNHLAQLVNCLCLRSDRSAKAVRCVPTIG
jgi:hypothetical protein